MAIGANITVWFPFLAVPIGSATVPVTLQTFFAILAGLMLGRKLGSLSMITYILVGVAGVPIFAGLKSGPMILFSATGGFIISFVFIAFFVGWIAEKSKHKKLLPFSIAAIIGLILNYSIGVTYMFAAMNFWLEIPISYSQAWIVMVPFMIKDFPLSLLAALFMVNLAHRLPGRWINRYATT